MAFRSGQVSCSCLIYFWINTNFNHSDLSLISSNCSQALQCAREPGDEIDKADNVMVF